MQKNKTGMRAAWFLILCAAMAVIAGSVLSKYSRIFGADKYVSRIIGQLSMLGPALVGTFYVGTKFGRRYTAEAMGFKRFHPGLTFFILLLPLCSRYFGIYIQSLGAAFTEKSFAVDAKTIPKDTYEMLMLFLSNCIIAPVLEETVFRGAVFKSVEPYGSWRAVLVSALGFAVIHFQASAFPYLLLWGIVLGLIRTWSGSVVACMLFHSILNFETFLHSVYVSELYYITDFLMGYASVMTHLFPVAMLAAYLCFGNGKSLKKTQRSGFGGLVPMLCVLILYVGIVYTKGL